MKILLFHFLLFTTLATIPDFSGKWSYDDENSSFILDLKQQGSQLTGQHISIMSGGNRIDGAYKTEQTIKGTVEGTQAGITIKSGYQGITGPAKLIWLGGDSIRFELTNPEQFYYIPSKITLKKVK